MRHQSFLVKLLVVVLALTMTAAAFANNGHAVGKPSGGGSAIEWQTSIQGYERLQATVIAPDGEVYVLTFGPGRNPQVRLADVGGADGQYFYELRVIPRVSADVQKKLKSARAANDDAAIRQITREAGLGTPVTQSGAFTIVNGSIVDPNALEGSGGVAVASARGMVSDGEISQPTFGGGRTAGDEVRAFDNVIADDLIVTGSACVGFDCVDGESFGFDTIRMKENNTQINFDDTSTSAGFPNNDWRLIANDSASGGANKFVVNDATAARNLMTITAAAPADSIFVANTGKVGFRQAAPLLDLHVTTGDTPAMRLEQTNASGFTAQTWDVGANEANFFIRDLTGGSRLPFRIRPGAPTSAIDVAASGNVGIGTASPTADLHVYSDATVDATVTLGVHNTTGPALNIGYGGQSYGRSSAYFNVRPDASATSPNPSLRFLTEDIHALVIDDQQYIGLGGVTNPTSPIHHSSGALLTAAGVWQSVSSREAKQHIEPLAGSEAIETLKGLTPVTYEYKALPQDRTIGFIAEDVPDTVATPDRKTLSAMDIVAVLTKVVQEQQKTIDELSKKVDQLQNNE